MQHARDVAVVARLGEIENRLQLGCHQVVDRSNQHHAVGSLQRLADPSEMDPAKERLTIHR